MCQCVAHTFFRNRDAGTNGPTSGKSCVIPTTALPALCRSHPTENPTGASKTDEPLFSVVWESEGLGPGEQTDERLRFHREASDRAALPNRTVRRRTASRATPSVSWHCGVKNQLSPVENGQPFSDDLHPSLVFRSRYHNVQIPHEDVR